MHGMHDDFIMISSCIFPTPGQQYDKDGILRHWWTNASEEAFRERQTCFEEQYSQYELFGYNVSNPLCCNGHKYLLKVIHSTAVMTLSVFHSGTD